MTKRTPADGLDLLAYADGLLDAEPARKEEVERGLRSSPEAMARARAFRHQTEQLRAAYAHRAYEAVPDRLYAALDPRPSRARATGLRAAVAACLAFAAGLGGWTIGNDEDRGWSAAEFVERSYAQFTEMERPASPTRVNVLAAADEALAWPASEFSLRLPAPDLSAAGYELVDKRSIAVDSTEMIRLDYAASDGRAFSLFMAPRWETPPAGITQAERDGVSLAHWLEGPLAATVVARMPAADTRRLAETLRGAIGRAGPAVMPAASTPPPGQEDSIVADTIAAPLQPSAPPVLDAREDGG